MSDAAQPSAAEVRAAAEALKNALDRHLAAIERAAAAPEGDAEARAEVYVAFNQMAAAGEAYDELLYDGYDEVTPFEVPASEGTAPYTGPGTPEALSVFMRRDYTVNDVGRLLSQARRIAELDPEATEVGEVDDEETVGQSVQAALGVLFGEFDPDEIATRHLEFGLVEGDATVWVAAAEPTEPGEWLASPFDSIDPARVLCRFDISDAFDEDDLNTVP